MSATLLGPKLGQKQTIKNLGYLFRNYADIQEFHVIGNPQNSASDFMLRVRFYDGRVYETFFASWQVSLERFWCRSVGELLELWELAKAGMLDGDTELLEAAGSPEFPEEPCHA